MSDEQNALHRSLYVACLLALLSFYGCGSVVGDSTAAAPSLTGNWNIVAQIVNPSVISNGNPTVTTITSWAFLSQNGTSISGTVVDNLCYPVQTTFPVTGSLNNGQLTLTPGVGLPSVPTQFSVSATVPTNLATFQGQGFNQPPCGLIPVSFTVTGQQVSAFNGKWAGTVTSASGPSATFTLTLTEAGPGSTGFPAVSGNVAISGSTCFTSGTFAGNQIGNNLSGTIATSNGTIEIPQIGGSGAFLDSNNNLVLSYTVQGGACNGDNAQGTLGRQ